MLKVLWLAIRPFSRLETAVGWWDVLNLIVVIAYPTVGGIVPLSQLFEKAPAIWWFGVPTLLLFVVAWKLQRRIDKIETKPQPNLEPFGLPYTDERELRSVDESRQLLGKPVMCHVKFYNNPNIRSPQSNALKVFTTITLYRMNGEGKATLDQVRASGMPEPPFRQPSVPDRGYYELEFNANGNPWEFTIALKYEENNNCYAVDDKSYASPKWERPEYVLEEKTYYVKVVLSGENTGCEWWYKLQNNGGKDIQLTPSSVPTFGKVG